jgi:hypothetical protein
LLSTSISGRQIVAYLAANSDIAATQDNPQIDFENDTISTGNVL